MERRVCASSSGWLESFARRPPHRCCPSRTAGRCRPVLAESSATRFCPCPHATGGNRLVVAIVGLMAIGGAILTLTGAAGYGFESESDLRQESEEELLAPIEKTAKETRTTMSLASLASLWCRWARLCTGSWRSGRHATWTVEIARRSESHRLRSDGRRIFRRPAGAGERREPIFGELNDFGDEDQPSRSQPASRGASFETPNRGSITPQAQPPRLRAPPASR